MCVYVLCRFAISIFFSLLKQLPWYFFMIIVEKKEKFYRKFLSWGDKQKNWGRYSTLVWPLERSFKVQIMTYLSHTNNPLQATIFHRIIFLFNTNTHIHAFTRKTAYWECDEGKYPISDLIFAGVGIKAL